jgi:NAD(P)-dependent dehydrogenase (short-subunit alcohol dehydrogenase family)
MNIIERMRLDGKKAIVTGAGQGLGQAFAHALAEAGADVAVVDLNIKSAEAVSKEIISLGRKSIPIEADLKIRDNAIKMVDDVINTWGRLDIAVNNVGVSKLQDALDVSEEDWNWTFDINLRGTFFCAQAEAKAMIPNGYGKIINIASICGYRVWPQFQSVYSISKAGILHLTKCLAVEWIKYGIRVNSISPGVTLTPGFVKEVIPIFTRQAPIAQTASVEDLKGAVIYLASETSDFMVGQDIVIDGSYINI